MIDNMSFSFQNYQDSVARCRTRDRARIVHAINELKRSHRHGAAAEGVREKLQSLIDESLQWIEARRNSAPSIKYPPELPITEYASELIRAIEHHPVVIVAGETGSGKSTQLPKLCLAAGRGIRGYIGCTQPRRVAARALAGRLREELQGAAPTAVGCKVRFSDSTHPDGLVKVMTDGILLAEVHHDRWLDAYDTIILDEAHERSLNIDFLLGYLHSLRQKRPDLKVIVTSATIDVARFAAFFGGAPVIEIPGRLYPVDLRYRPVESTVEDVVEAVTQTAGDLVSSYGDGDILVFLPGEREIREVAEALRGLGKHRAEVLPLYARQSAAEQARIFSPGGRRRVVLATNVAETSLTLPRIRFVIDTGTARVSRFAKGSKVQRLPIEPISRASADQRAGRCGRLGPGICVRLYGEEDYHARPRFTTPEILRTNLASVILRMKALGIGDVDQFPFLEPPDARHIRSGVRELVLLGALDAQHRLTVLGKRMVRFPVDPRFGRIIAAGQEHDCLSEMLVVVSALSVVDPRERPFDKRQQADQSHGEFCDPRSDFVSLLNLWRFVLEQKRHLSRRKFRALCLARFLSPTRVMEWIDVHRELAALVAGEGMKVNDAAADYERVHRALLFGLVDRVARKLPAGVYEGMHQRRLRIFPGSCTVKSAPGWIVAAEWVETSQLFARTCAQIEPDWIVGPAGEFRRERYFDPYVEYRSGRVKGFCEVGVFGLVILPRKRVDFARHEPARAREIFISQALIEGRMADPPPFLRHNAGVVEALHRLEAKHRLDGIAPTEQDLVNHYATTLPAEVVDGPTLRLWLNAHPASADGPLRLNERQLAEAAGVFVAAQSFPDSLEVSNITLRLTYDYSPGQPSDGVTAHVPLAALNGLSVAPFEWLVPGYLREKIAALLKALPKQWRKNFVPVPQYAAACAAALKDSHGPLLPSITAKLAAMTGVQIPSHMWQLDRLPIEYLFRFVVEDEQGHVVADGRDLLALQQRFGAVAHAEFAARAAQQWNRASITHWDMGDLPDQVVSYESAGARVPGFPALDERGQAVALHLFDNAVQARERHGLGVRRLLLLEAGAKVKALKRQMPQRERLCLWYRTVGTCDDLFDDLCCAVVDRQFGDELASVRTQYIFEKMVQRLQPALVAAGFAIGEEIGRILQAYDEARRALLEVRDFGLGEAVTDIRDQLSKLVYSHVFRETSPECLVHYPRYLRAIVLRMEKLRQDPQRDSRRAAEVLSLWQAFWRQHSNDSMREWSKEESDFRWMLEEFRVSLFAQEVGTAYPISEKRLTRAWDALNKTTGF